METIKRYFVNWKNCFELIFWMVLLFLAIVIGALIGGITGSNDIHRKFRDLLMQFIAKTAAVLVKQKQEGAEG